MHCTGVDIIEIARIRRVIDRWGERFLHRVYTEAEIRLCRNRSGALATRFAAKEAVMKALGTGVREVGWKEIEILNEHSGKPTVRLHGNARNKADKLGLDELAVSLSDSRENAIAFVIGETR
ncbi:MAG: holo-ACP synthase [Dehalococcoidales bacterium]